MKKILIILIVVVAALFNSNSYAQTRRALLIGIDTYNPDNNPDSRWINLNGCVNDILSVNELIQARYGFSKDSITVLTNAQAGREQILSNFEKLLNISKKGDIAVIYYSGHGSQVKNSLSEEADKRDESMVPADSYKGVKDIRDKELAAVFNKFLDKGVVLTVIYDCCHSGSMGRGGLSDDQPKYRNIAPSEIDAMDSTQVPSPENRGMLIMSASQDFEFASEQQDNNKIPHGAFTIALLQTLNNLPVNANVTTIFSSIRAILKYNGKKQEPVLAGSEERKLQTIFGIEKGILSGKTMVAVIKKEDTLVKLQGGVAVGININSELIRKIDETNTVKLKVISLDGLNKCSAIVTSGDIKSIKAGDLFELSSWTSASGTLKITLPKSDYGYDELFAIAQNLNQLKNSKNITIITDTYLEKPTHTIYYNGTKWMMGFPDGTLKDIGITPSEKSVSKLLSGISDVKLLISLPATKDFYATLTSKFDENSAVEVIADASKAQYFLSGRIRNDSLAYAFILPSISGSDTAFECTMPVRTDYYFIKKDDNSANNASDSLTEASLKLAKIKAWLTLSGPPDDGSFPFYLALKDANTNKIITDGVVKKGDFLGLVFLLDKANEDYWDLNKRYVYVLLIDNKGKVTLAYPLNGSVENKLPRNNSDGVLISECPLGNKRLIKVAEPLGVDTYVMLTTDEPITNPEFFNQEGLITRGSKGDKGGLSQLLSIGAKTRGELNTPANWSIYRLTVKSIP